MNIRPIAMNDERIHDLPAASMESRLRAAKRAYTTRRVESSALRSIVSDRARPPRPGDLVLARVDRLGKHRHLELVSGRRSTLFEGDEIIVAFGHRYAPDQFEAYVPDNLAACHLAAGGGIAARVVNRHEAAGVPTSVTPIGFVAGADGTVLNVDQFALGAGRPTVSRPPVIACLGTSMNAGKTTSAAFLIRGLAQAGLRVGAAKVTGTGSGNDPWLMRDAGAEVVVDFTDAGHASTFQLPPERLVGVARTLVAHLEAQSVEIVVLEIADGLLQGETAALFQSPEFADLVDGVVFAAADSTGAIAGSRWLGEAGLNVLAVCGTLTRSPLAVREAAGGMPFPVLTLAQLANAACAAELHSAATRRSLGAVA